MSYDEIIEAEILSSIDKLFHEMRTKMCSAPIAKTCQIQIKEKQKDDLKKLLSQYIDEQFKVIVVRDFLD